MSTARIKHPRTIRNLEGRRKEEKSVSPGWSSRSWQKNASEYTGQCHPLYRLLHLFPKSPLEVDKMRNKAEEVKQGAHCYLISYFRESATWLFLSFGVLEHIFWSIYQMICQAVSPSPALSRNLTTITSPLSVLGLLFETNNSKNLPTLCPKSSSQGIIGVLVVVILMMSTPSLLTTFGQCLPPAITQLQVHHP